jgi:serine/threonine protein kinase
MVQQANQPLPSGYQLENYRIASVLASGGFSIVYLAHDENDQPVAIKEYLPSQLALRKEGDVLPSVSEENWLRSVSAKCFFEGAVAPVAPERRARAQFLSHQRYGVSGDAL